jgi:hypothetical protein
LRKARRLAGDRKQHFRDFITSFRETNHVRPDEQLYLSTLPMNGCHLLQTTNMSA